MNGIEVEGIMFSHQFARHCPDPVVKQQLAHVRYIEAQQQKAVNWLLPGLASVLETTLAYEQVAVDLTSWVARMEPDPYLRQAYEFGVLEDFDHLYLYHSFMQIESGPRIKAIWELHLNMELEHLRLAVELFNRHDTRDVQQVVAPELPAPVTFEPNKAFVRDLLATQIDYTTIGTGYVQEAHERFEKLQEQIHGGEKPPSERVIDDNRDKSGEEYRVETEGPHPLPSLRKGR